MTSNFTAHFKDLSKHSVQIAGGKGAQLGEMFNSGIPVPLGFIVLTHSFNHFIQSNALGPKIKDVLDKVDKEDIEPLNAILCYYLEINHGKTVKWEKL